MRQQESSKALENVYEHWYMIFALLAFQILQYIISGTKAFDQVISCKKAFDMVDHGILLSKLEAYNLRPFTLVQTIFNFN